MDKPSAGRPTEGVANIHPMPQPGGRFVPRPPASLGNSTLGTTPSRAATSPAMSGRGVSSNPTRSKPALMASNHNVPRPPQSFGRVSAEPSRNMGAAQTSLSPMSRNVPRPSAGSFNRPVMSAHNIAPSAPASSRSFGNSSPARSMPSVPRPTGRIMPAPRDYSSSAQSRGSYSARSYGGQSSPYGGGRGNYSSPYSGSRGMSSYGGGRSYSAPSHSSGGSYGGGRSYSAPSHSSGGSYHGSSGGSSSHGGHSGR